MIAQVGTRCVGCGACVAVCPKKCLSLKENKNGFKYPEADMQKCTNCSLCDKSCPVLAENHGNAKVKKAIAVKAVDDSIVQKSSSGGAFYLIAAAVIRNGGCVCGAEIDKSNHVRHIIVYNLDDLYKLLGSKYVQSDMEDVYSEIEKHLKEGRQVLFSGTPCQVNSLYSFLGKDYDNLLTVDLICHGVPSPYVWRKYVDFMEKKHGTKIIGVNFRNKPKGWENSGLELKFDNGESYFGMMREDTFFIQFLNNLDLRKSCYSCEFKGSNRAADITIGDFWGINKVYPELYTPKGVSLVAANTDKGMSAIEDEPQLHNSPEVNLSKALQKNAAYYGSAEKVKFLNGFANALEKMPFDKAVRKYMKRLTNIRRIASYVYKLKRIVKRDKTKQ